MDNQSKPTTWIRIPDFAEVSLWISVTNTTTQVAISDDSHVELTEVGEKDLTLKLPFRSCALGHFLTIRIRKTQKVPWKPESGLPKNIEGPVHEIEFTAKVSDEESLNKEFKAVLLTLYQFDVAEWDGFVSSIGAHQEKINQIVRNIRE